MKKTHIIGLIVIAIAVAILVSTGTEASTYVDFSVAENMAKLATTTKYMLLVN